MWKHGAGIIWLLHDVILPATVLLFTYVPCSSFSAPFSPSLWIRCGVSFFPKHSSEFELHVKGDYRNDEYLDCIFTTKFAHVLNEFFDAVKWEYWCICYVLSLLFSLHKFACKLENIRVTKSEEQHVFQGLSPSRELFFSLMSFKLVSSPSRVSIDAKTLSWTIFSSD